MTSDIDVYREGSKAYRHKRSERTKLGTAGVRVESCGVRTQDGVVVGDYREVRLDFEAERGTGDSEYELCVRAESFEGLALAMIRADRDAAIKAFGAALLALPASIEGYISRPSRAA